MLLVRFLNRLIRIGALTVVDATDRIHRFGGGEPAITVRLHDLKLTRRLFFQPELAVGTAYMDGTLTIENATLYDFLDLIGRNYAHGGFSGLNGPFDRFRRPLRWLSSFNSRHRSRKNVAHHYDLNGALYDLFLDRERHYSCAYFIHESDSLEEAQQQKCRHIAAKLLLKPGMRVLDIGSGWGGMALYLAERFDAEVVGITLSDEQLKVAQQRAQKAHSGLRTRFFLRDYREEEGSYERILSIGMFEHVGPSHYERFFHILRDRLVNDGVALLHTIGQLDTPGPTSPWVRKYIFPGGHIPALSEVVPAIEGAGLLITDVEVLRLHYAETLRHWRQRFLANWELAKALYDERFCRMWEFYLAGSEIAFRYMNLCIFQIQLAKRIDAVPLIRDYMVDTERELAAGEEASSQKRTA